MKKSKGDNLMKRMIITFLILFTSISNAQWKSVVYIYDGDYRINVSTAIAKDNNNNKYVTGYVQTQSSNYIAVTIKYQPFFPNPIWVSRYTSSFNFFPTSVAANTSNGTVYVTGTTDSGGNGKNIFLLSYSAVNGNLNWARIYKGSGNGDDEPKKVIFNNGFVYVAGYSCERDSLSKEYLLLKYDLNGNLIYKRNYSYVSNSSDEVNDMIINNIGDIYLTGKSIDSTAKFDYATLKYNINGNLIWSKRYASLTNGNDVAVSVFQYNNLSELVVTGYADTTVDYTTIKYDSSGNQLWKKVYNGTGNGFDYPVSVRMDFPGNILVTGSSMGAGLNYDYLTIKYNNIGNEQWVNRYNGTADHLDSVAGMEIDNFGCIFVTGKSKNVSSKYDITSILYNTAGWSHWIRVYNYNTFNGDEIPYGLVKDNSYNTFTITGRADSSLGRSSFLTFTYSGVIDVLDFISDQIPEKFLLHQNYPNPFNPDTRIRFEIPESGYIELKIYSVTGIEIYRYIKENLSIGTYETSFNGNGLSSGIYFYRLQFSNGSEVISHVKKMTFVK